MNNTLKQALMKVLTHAKEKDLWVATDHLTPHGLHITIVYLLEDNGHLITETISNKRCIKLTLKGYRHFKQMLEENNNN